MKLQMLFVSWSILLIPAISFALTGSGTEADPYLIQSVADFDEFAGNSDFWDDYISLKTDIDLAGRTYTTAVIAPDMNYTQYGTFEGTPFTGVFAGNGHAISNLTIDTAETGNDYLGLFGRIEGSGAEVKDLSIENVDITEFSAILVSFYVGGLVGYNSNGIISNCSSTGSVEGYSRVGGLSGYNEGSVSNCSSAVSVEGYNILGGLVGGNNTFGSIISDCSSTGPVTGNKWVGGLAGFNEGSISNCHSTGSVEGISGYVGGLVGYNGTYGIISDCYSTGLVTGISGSVGGLVGGNNYRGGIINCYSTGTVTGDEEVGGLCGWNHGNISSCYSEGFATGNYYTGGLVGHNSHGNISNCHSMASVEGGSKIGGLVGRSHDSTISNSYSTGSVEGSNYDAGGLAGELDGGWISNCYSTGSVTGDIYVGGLVGKNNQCAIRSSYSAGSVTGSTSVGGLVGYNYYGSVVYSFWDFQTSGIGGSNGGTGKTTAEMKTLSTFIDAGWDFTEDDGDAADWMMLREGEDYPRLAWQEVLTGDIAGLYGVDWFDFGELALHWGESCSGDCEDGDIDGDGSVGLGDLVYMVGNWGE